jgi:hypothetical protein
VLGFGVRRSAAIIEKKHRTSSLVLHVHNSIMNDVETIVIDRNIDAENMQNDVDVAASIPTTGASHIGDNMVELLLPQHPDRRRRRLVGRAARRRRRKIKEICAMESSLMEQQQTQSQSPDTLKDEMIHRHRDNGTVPTDMVLPADRDRIWPAVLELRHRFSTSTSNDDTLQTRLTNDDNISLTGQLGYVPGNAIHVVCRVKDLYSNHKCSMKTMLFQQPSGSTATAKDIHSISNIPVVLQLYPMVYRNPHAGGKSGGKRFKLRKRQKIVLPTNIDPPAAQSFGAATTTIITTTATTATNTKVTAVDNTTEKQRTDDSMLIEPFPTIYWLTHPLLRCIVSKLELEGYGLQLERRLHDDAEDAKRMMKLAHDAYGQERYQFLSQSDRQLIQEYGWETAFATSRGIAGIRNNILAVKCLHAHLAHYLSDSIGSQNNIVGRWVWEEIQIRYADPTANNATTVSSFGD